MGTKRYLNILNSGLIIRALSFLFVCTLYGHFLLANVFEPRLTQRSQLNRVFFLLFLEHAALPICLVFEQSAREQGKLPGKMYASSIPTTATVARGF